MGKTDNNPKPLSGRELEHATSLAAGELHADMWRPKTAEEAKQFLAAAEHYRDAHLKVAAGKEFERQDKPLRRADLHRAKAQDARVVAKRLSLGAETNVQKAAQAIEGREAEYLDDQTFATFRSAVSSALSMSEQAKRARRLAKQHTRAEQKLRASVKSEPKPYGPESRNSWFVDRAIAAQPDATVLPAIAGVGAGRFGDISPAEVHERMRRHAIDVRRAVLKRNRWGKQIERQLREQKRQDDAQVHERRYREDLKSLREDRTLTTGGGVTASSPASFAAFVAPAFILQQYAVFRDAARTFADQCGTWPMPDFGMELYVPYFATGAAASQQVEGSGVSDATPTTALQGAQVQTVSGEVAITQQLRDRGYSGRGSFDEVIAAQLGQQLAARVNILALNTVIAGGAAVSGASSWTWSTQGIAPLYQDIAKGREVLTDTAGVLLRPTHFFSTSDFYSWVSRQTDATTFRPTFLPMFAPGFPIATGADDGPQSTRDRPKWSRFTGSVLPGGVLWLTDDAIPPSGSNTQLIVSAPDQSVLLSESTPTLSVYPETFAPNLTSLATLRSYVAVITRHASGTAVITGSAYPTSLI
jgi:hypothetical protein